MDFQRSGKPLVKSLPCAKGGGTRQRDGGIVIQRKHKNNPSVSFADSSLYTREPFLASAPPSTSHSFLEGGAFICLRTNAGRKKSASLLKIRWIARQQTGATGQQMLTRVTGRSGAGDSQKKQNRNVQYRQKRQSNPSTAFFGGIKVPATVKMSENSVNLCAGKDSRRIY